MQNHSSENNTGTLFWDRQRELERLREWRAHEPRLAVIHGRRRLDKTALLRHWLTEAAGSYVQATEGTPVSQRAALAADLDSTMPGFGEVVYPSWKALLDALKRQWPGQSRVLVLDEFSYLARSAPELPSLLQALVDARDARRLPIVLCGSSQQNACSETRMLRPSSGRYVS